MTNHDDQIVYRPQPGPQTEFLKSDADIVIFGGAAGGGKTYALLLEATRFFHLDSINAAIFRRTQSQLSMPGSIWPEAQKLYNSLGLKANHTRMAFKFGRHSAIKFCGLQYESDVHNFQGAQLDFIGFDELTHFSEEQFWYLIGRLRSSSGKIKPYARATCNPDAGSWVHQLVGWWIDDKTGYPIPERQGQKRWLLKLNDVNYWFSSREMTLLYKKSKGIDDRINPLSVTFIAATINDNQILLKNDPSYYAKLSQLPDYQKMPLLYGCWLLQKIGKLFKHDWFRHFVIEPPDFEYKMITTDTASSTKTANDYTVMQLWGYSDSRIYLLDQIRGKYTAHEQETLLINLIRIHKVRYCSIERAAMGFVLIDALKKENVLIEEMTRSKDKYSRGYEVQEFFERGYVWINPNSAYYTVFISEMTSFSPENKNSSKSHDDIPDCAIDAAYLAFIKKIGYHSNIKLKTNYLE